MTDLTLNEKEELNNLRKRIDKLSKEKAQFQFTNHLLDKLIHSMGIENMIDSILECIFEVIGGSNIILYYIIDNVFYYRDYLKKASKLDSLSDPNVAEVFKSRVFIEDNQPSNTYIKLPGFSEGVSWYFPIIASKQIIGVIKLEGIYLRLKEMKTQLESFFVYVAIFLRSEILEYSNLNRANKELQLKYIELQNEINERKQIEEELKRKNKDLLESQRIARLGTWRLNLATNQVVWTEELYKMYGFDPTLPPPSYSEHMKLFTPESWDKLSTAIERTKESGTSYEFELETVVKEGPNGWIWVRGEAEKDSEGNIIAIFGAARDITEQKRFEEEKRITEALLSQQQRLESIGILAGGVAHEINNPINGIMNYGQLILDSIDADSENAIYAKEIIHETERITNIVRNLLQFSRNDKQEHSYSNVKDIIESTISLINMVIKKDQIDLQINIPEDLPELKCRSQQIQQVIMNLLTNSRDALNEKYQGYHEDKIIKLYCKQFNKENRRWVRITVEDHGNGIPEAMHEKIFEPFYSSKSRDKGTGLGLSISHGIIKDHHGRLMFETKEGSYTKFYLDLPVDNGWELEN